MAGYATTTEASAYFAARGLSSEWAAVTNPDAALLIGSEYLDARYGLLWIGKRATQAQDRAWPRINAVDPDGYKITDVPVAVKNASMEAAFKYGQGVDLAPDFDSSQQITSEKVGPLAVTYASGVYADQLPRFSYIDGLLAGLLKPSMDGIRPYYGPAIRLVS